MIKAAIFDMDGILIDSEPLWQEAEKKVFAQVGIEIPTEMCLETMGMRTDEVVACRYKKQKWSAKSCKEVEVEILSEMVDLIKQKGVPMQGVDYILDFFAHKNVRLALATSSPLRIIQTVLNKLHLHRVFEVIHSAEFEQYGKPHPAIYISTLRKLNLKASEVLVFEDSYNGLLSAKAAKLRTVVIPEKSVWHDSRYDLAGLKLKSLLEFKQEHLQRLAKG
ncbi:MAG: hexitol phosphatase HxpB [bacterium]